MAGEEGEKGGYMGVGAVEEGRFLRLSGSGDGVGGAGGGSGGSGSDGRWEGGHLCVSREEGRVFDRSCEALQV